uniref:Retroviral envelope protein GP41-like domain-containing protein n=1 Tax=Callithrix jacchus TaxID=9483 RepID=A0A8I3WNB2_CALJA
MCFYASRVWESAATRIELNQHSNSGPNCLDLGYRQQFTFEVELDFRPGEETYVLRDWVISYLGIKESENVTSIPPPSLKDPSCTSFTQSFSVIPSWRHCYHGQVVTYTLPNSLVLHDWSIATPLSLGYDHYEVPGGWITPLLTTPSGQAYSSIWRLFLALYPSGMLASLRSNNTPKVLQIIYVQACVASPYAILYGNISISEISGHYSITCPDCVLTNCIDSTVFPTPVFMIVHQHSYVMLPVNISGPWYDDRGLQVLQQVMDLMVHPKRFLGLLIASIIAIVTLVATAATAAVSLANNIQTAAYVNHLAKNISTYLGTQMDIDKKLEAKLNALEETVTLLRDKVYNIQNRLALRCHAEFTFICVTNKEYNASEWQWPLVKTHLQGIWSHNNLSLDIRTLQKQIYAIDASREQLPVDATIAKDIVNTLSSWLQWSKIPSFLSLIGLGVLVLFLILLLPVIL